jgi:transposase InsO family protein
VRSNLCARKFLWNFLQHSDRGCQHASKEFRSLLAEHQAGASMSRKGNCYENAAMESFWASLKTECFS